MQLTPHFSLAECESHRLCAKHGLPVELNKIPVHSTLDQPLATLTEWTLACQHLETARARLQAPITISCGYRAPRLNTAAGGVPTSQHLGFRHVQLGADQPKRRVPSVAFDLQTSSNPLLKQLFEILLTLPHDQLIFENNSKGTIWIHWSWLPYHPNRQQNFTMAANT